MCNFHTLEFVGRGSETQLEVRKKLNSLRVLYSSITLGWRLTCSADISKTKKL